MTAQVENFPPLSPPIYRTQRTRRCSCEKHWKKASHNIPSRHMSISFLFPSFCDPRIRSQYSSLPSVHPIVVKPDDQTSEWVTRSKGEAVDSIQSMSDTSDYFSSSPTNSKELIDSDYESEKESGHPLKDLFRSEVPLTSSSGSHNNVRHHDQASSSNSHRADASGSSVTVPLPKGNSQTIPLSSQNLIPGGKDTTYSGKNSLVDSSSSPSVKCKGDDSRTRVKDEEGFVRRAACVCLNEDQSKVLLITSKTDPEGWLIPGGGLEEDEPEEMAAQREVWEEAGVKGKILRCLGTFQSVEEQTKKKRTAVFLLKVTEMHHDFPEAVTYGRRREWFTIEDAIQKLKKCKPNQIFYLQDL